MMGVYLVLIGVDLRPVQGGARRLRARPGQAVSGRLRAAARRRHARPHRRGDPPHERHRAQAAGRRKRGGVSRACRSTASPTARMPASCSSTLKPFEERKAPNSAAARSPMQLNQQVRRDPGSLHRHVPAAAGAGARHHRRLQAADRGPRRARLRGARRGHQGVRRQGARRRRNWPGCSPATRSTCRSSMPTSTAPRRGSSAWR